MKKYADRHYTVLPSFLPFGNLSHFRKYIISVILDSFSSMFITFTMQGTYSISQIAVLLFKVALALNRFCQCVHLIVFYSWYPLQVIIEACQQPFSCLNVLFQHWLLDCIFPFHLGNDKLRVTLYVECLYTYLFCQLQIS